MHSISNTPNLTSLSLAGTMPMHNRGLSELKVPMPRYSIQHFHQIKYFIALNLEKRKVYSIFNNIYRMGLEPKRIRRHEMTSSSEEDDSVDLLGSSYQVRNNQTI